MTDTLRTRIAAAIARVVVDDGLDVRHHALYDMADAVIRELELHRELEIVKDRAQPRHRYVTDWAADEIQ